MNSLYFNHAGTSFPKPDFVRDAVQQAMQRDPHCWEEVFAAAQRELCDFFKIPDVQQLLLTPGCTSAISTAIADLIWLPNDRVLHTQWEHHALHRQLIKLKDQDVLVEAIPTGSNSAVDLSSLERMLSNGNVRLVGFTAASNVTGEILPIQKMIQLAHQYSALVLLDAAQVVGWLDLDFQELQADLIAFGSHKGLLAPWGIGGLYIAEHVPMECVSAKCSVPTDETIKIKQPRPGYCDVGSVDQFTLAGLQAAVKWLKEQDLEASRLLACKRIQLVREVLDEFDFVKVHSPDDHDHQLPSIAFSIRNINSGEFANRLLDAGIVVSGGFQCAPLAHQSLGTEEHGVVRISLGIQQSQGEVERLLASLKSELAMVKSSSHF